MKSKKRTHREIEKKHCNATNWPLLCMQMQSATVWALLMSVFSLIYITW